MVRRGPNRSVMYAESEELHYIYGHDWNPMPDMEVDILRGGSYFWKGGSRKGGFGRTLRTPPGYGPARATSFTRKP